MLHNCVNWHHLLQTAYALQENGEGEEENLKFQKFRKYNFEQYTSSSSIYDSPAQILRVQVEEDAHYDLRWEETDEVRLGTPKGVGGMVSVWRKRRNRSSRL